MTRGIPSHTENPVSLILVEDEPYLRHRWHQELENEGYVVACLSTGIEALDALRNSSVALAILDIKLPGMNGLEVLAQLRQEHIHTPVILYTAHPHYREDPRCRHADGFVTKSSDITELKRVVKALLKENQ